MGREPETMSLVETLVKSAELPLVLDADALQPAAVRAGKATRLLTPHAGEYLRIAGGEELAPFSKHIEGAIMLKGPISHIAHRGDTYRSFFAGPVLARGGSGDLLAGLSAGLLAQRPKEPLLAAQMGSVWHGLAADLMARRHGQAAVRSTGLLDFLPEALRARDDA
jgi:ADP-dependent NAD(P)H-hydrate dehydratase / NAD(P)H-hydrate epimerase